MKGSASDSSSRKHNVPRQSWIFGGREERMKELYLQGGPRAYAERASASLGGARGRCVVIRVASATLAV